MEPVSGTLSLGSYVVLPPTASLFHTASWASDAFAPLPAQSRTVVTFHTGGGLGWTCALNAFITEWGLLCW